MANSTLFPAQCLAIEEFLLDPMVSSALNLTIVLLGTCLFVIGILIHQFVQHGFPVHGNLLLLFGNIVVCTVICFVPYFIYFLRYKFLLLIYTNPCQLLTPFWTMALAIGPISYIYTVAHPALHFCIMLERLRATFMAQKYEQKGRRWGICIVVAIWLYSLAYFAFGVTAAYIEIGDHLQDIPQLTSSLSAKVSMFVMALNVVLVLLTSLCDCRITALNKKLARERKEYDGTNGYSLSRNYQVQENVLAMRLILPLDLCHALLFSIYMAAMLTLRANFAVLSRSYFDLGCNLAINLLFVYSLLTMIVYIRFVRFVSKSKRWRRANTVATNDYAKIYFKQLEAQWQSLKGN